ncbi:metallophosphoesterase family protein [[Eubacterium] hominis]|uniref:metallophosphoesterase family protein n=1 Tax=[Eubacterium] hominis TaxID=2764325 RepID=UPI003A4D33F3
MKVILVSDSHGKDDALEMILKQYPDADAYVHCGDIETYPECFPQFVTVRGNNDVFYEYPEEQVLHIGGHGIYVTHSHHFMYSKRLEQMALKAKSLDCDVVFYGHTHIAADDTIDGVRIINPGSIWRSRDGRGPSYAVIDMDEDHIQVEFIFLPQKKSRWGFF